MTSMPPPPFCVPLQWVMYLESEDAKYSHWTSDECSSRWVVGWGGLAGWLAGWVGLGWLAELSSAGG